MTSEHVSGWRKRRVVELTITAGTGFAVHLSTVTQVDGAGRVCCFETFAEGDFPVAKR